MSRSPLPDTGWPRSQGPLHFNFVAPSSESGVLSSTTVQPFSSTNCRALAASTCGDRLSSVIASASSIGPRQHPFRPIPHLLWWSRERLAIAVTSSS